MDVHKESDFKHTECDSASQRSGTQREHPESRPLSQSRRFNSVFRHWDKTCCPQLGIFLQQQRRTEVGTSAGSHAGKKWQWIYNSFPSQPPQISADIDTHGSQNPSLPGATSSAVCWDKTACPHNGGPGDCSRMAPTANRLPTLLGKLMRDLLRQFPLCFRSTLQLWLLM